MITACAIGATVLELLDQTIANVALPYMQGSFSSSFDEIIWVLGARLMKRRLARAISPGNGGREQRFIHFRPFEGHVGSISSYGAATLTYRRNVTSV
jgi:hypothetical protein